MADKYDALKLDHQLCFPLYACSREIIKLYKPCLDRLELTYTQYIAMMVMWEEREVNVKEMGDRLHLDSGTLSGVLKKLEAKHYVTRQRSKIDERNLIIRIAPEGEALRERALEIPAQMAGCNKLSPEESKELYRILYKILDEN